VDRSGPANGTQRPTFTSWSFAGIRRVSPNRVNIFLMSRRTRVCLAFVTVAGLAGVVYGQRSHGPKSRQLTRTEARELVYAMLKADEWTKMAAFDLEEKGPELGFYSFRATCSNPERNDRQLRRRPDDGRCLGLTKLRTAENIGAPCSPA
jgi:hypothetical protein